MSKKRKRGQDAAFDQGEVLRVFRQRGKPVTVRDLLKALGLDKVHKAKLGHMLETLAREGRIIAMKDAWGLAENMNLISGKLEIQRSGVGYVIRDDRKGPDIFVNPRDFGDAWHGDRVAVALSGRRGVSPEGRVARVLERGFTTLPCRVDRRIRQGLYLCRPTDPRQPHSLLLELEPGQDMPGIGDVLALTPGEKLDYQLYAAEEAELLGNEKDASVQERLVKINHSIPGPFPQHCLDQAAGLPTVPGEDDFRDRTDLRHMDFVTIDGAKARDFDDAIHVELDGRGFRLRVAIADVSHYVPLGSPLDLEAMERGNSYYFPQSVEPMFPEALSNGLCSLNPGVPRLAMVADIRMSANGVPGDTAFYPAVIESKARLTYDQVNRAVILRERDERGAIAHVLPMLEDALRLAREVNARRLERGSLDFDLPEPEILINLQGETEDIRPRERHFGHQIIEEFMIAANEAVARRLTERGAPLPYRIHPEPDPDKLETLFGILRRTDLYTHIPATPSVTGLQAMLAAAHGTDMEFLASRLLLRSMMQAKYHTQNLGHFGLASECYCHFTSPIRRYADLMVHRALKAVLEGREPPLPARRMQGVCEDISLRERVAMDAEREILKRLTVLFLADKVGQSFEGVISSLSDFGFWVELTGVMAEGLVRLSTLTDDYYALFPERQELLGQNTGRRFHLGQHVRVDLAEVHLGRLEVNLTLAEGESGDRPRRRPPRTASQGAPSRRAGQAAGPGGRGGATAGGRKAGRGARSRDDSRAKPGRNGGKRRKGQ